MIIKRNGVVLPPFRTEMRNPGIEVDEYPQAAFLTLALSGPRITVRGDGSCHTALDAVSRKYPGVMPGDVHSSQQREERTKKRRRCYRALSLGGWHRPRGLRNSLRSDNPRPHASVGWPPPGPIKAEGERCDASFQSFRATTRNPEIPSVIPGLTWNPGNIRA